MPKPWIAVQLAAASTERSSFTDLERSLGRARELARSDAVIIRPSADVEHASRLAAVSRRLGLEVYLWFPVLADSPSRAGGTGRLTRAADDTVGHGRSGAWPGLGSGEETFLFHCPNAGPVTRSACASLVLLLDAMEPDGVMLDKVRFPGPSNGLEALFSCFCDACASSFQAATGHSMEEMRRRALDALDLLRSRGPAALRDAWKEPGEFWAACGLAELSSFRARSITAAAEAVIDAARGRSCRVGLDLFSPSLAPLVGQDYGALGGLCDWVKPMVYRLAAGPAGLPLEIGRLWAGFRALHPPAGDAARAALERAFGWQLPATESELLERGLPSSVIASELRRLDRGRHGTRAKVYAGIEAVRIPSFGIDVGPRALEESLAAVDGHADGIIASWDLAFIPEENLRVIGSVAA